MRGSQAGRQAGRQACFQCEAEAPQNERGLGFQPPSLFKSHRITSLSKSPSTAPPWPGLACPPLDTASEPHGRVPGRCPSTKLHATVPSMMLQLTPCPGTVAMLVLVLVLLAEMVGASQEKCMRMMLFSSMLVPQGVPAGVGWAQTG